MKRRWIGILAALVWVLVACGGSPQAGQNGVWDNSSWDSANWQ